MIYKMLLACGFLIMLGFTCSGCGRGPAKRHNLAEYFNSEQTIFAYEDVSEFYLTNDAGRNVPGLLIKGVAFLPTAADLKQRTNRLFGVVSDLVLSGIIQGEYWRLQQARSTNVSLPSYLDYWGKYTLVTVDSNQVVIGVQEGWAAVYKLSVDTNDFGKPFKQ